VLKKADSYRQLVKVNRYFSEHDGGEGDLLGRSSSITTPKAVDRTRRPNRCHRAHHGENGTARKWSHANFTATPPRRNEPYIKVNCAALSESLIESELFDTKKALSPVRPTAAKAASN